MNRFSVLFTTVTSPLWMFTTVHAQSEAMPVYELEPFVVVAPHTLSAGAEVTAGSVRSAKPVDLAAILASELPAAALTRKGPLAGDMVLRGLSRDNLVISVDDNKTFCACPNRMDPPAFHVSSQQIEGIRVRKGPFSVEQGGSIGGTIAVRTTPPPQETFTRLYAYAGSYEYWAAGVTAGSPLTESWTSLGGFYFQRGGVYEDGAGVPFTALPGSNYLPGVANDPAFEVYTAEAKAAYSFGKTGSVTLNYAWQDARDVLYPGLRMDAPTDTMNRGSVALRMPLPGADWADNLEASLAFSHVDHDMRDSLRMSLNNMGGAFVQRGYFMRTEAESTFAGMRLKLDKRWGTQAMLRYGIDLKRRLWNADNIIGNQTNDMLPDTVTDSAGVWAVYEWREGSWAWEAGARFDVGRSEARDDIAFLQGLQNTQTNERWDSLPSLYGLLSRDWGQTWQSYVGLGFASRVPDPQERYMNLNRPMMNTDWVGSPDLEPVRTLELQAGLRWHHQAFDAELSAFHAWLFDYIYLTQLAIGASATTYENIDARLYGFSADAGWQVSEYLRLEAGLAWQEGAKRSRPALATNDVLGEVPPLRARLSAVLSVGDFSAQAHVQMQEDLDRIDPDLSEQALSGWTVLNVAASYQMTEQFSLSAGLDNVFDETYAVANAFVRDPFRSGVLVHEPGRFAYLRIGAQF